MYSEIVYKIENRIGEIKHDIYNYNVWQDMFGEIYISFPDDEGGSHVFGYYIKKTWENKVVIDCVFQGKRSHNHAENDIDEVVEKMLLIAKKHIEVFL